MTDILTTPRPRLVQLDILRGVAILLVLGSHTPFSPPETGPFATLAAGMHRFGWSGVDLFFVLSGFLIGGLLFQEIRKHGALDLPRFFIRRGFKIWPSYYLLVLVAFLLVMARAHGNVGIAFRTMFPNLIHLQNYWPGDRPAGQTWSLAVEEHFYLFLPFFLLLALRWPSARNLPLPAVPIGAGGVFVFCLLYRCLVNTRHPFVPRTHLFETHIRMDSLFFGVLLAYMYHFLPQRLETVRRRPALFFGLGLLLVSPMLFLVRETTPFVWTAGYSLLAAGYGSILLAMLFTGQAGSRGEHIIRSPPLRLIAWIGTYSYTIYLWMAVCAERPTAALFHHLPQIPQVLVWPLSTALYFVLAVAAGCVGGRIVDKPALALRDRLFPGRATALRDTAPATPLAEERSRP